MSKQVLSKKDMSGFVTGQIVPRLKPGTVFLLSDDLGAGKTFLVQEALQQAFNLSSVLSPTFAYVQKYSFKQQVVAHFDLYRLQTEQEFFDLGFEQVLSSSEVISFVEWPEVIQKFADGLAKQKLVHKLKLDFSDVDVAEGRVLQAEFANDI